MDGEAVFETPDPDGVLLLFGGEFLLFVAGITKVGNHDGAGREGGRGRDVGHL